MPDKPRTFEEWIKPFPEGPYYQGDVKRVWEVAFAFGKSARDEEVAAKDRRIASLEADATDTAMEKKALQAQIDQVRALGEEWYGTAGYRDHANAILAALGEPAATPEREP